MKQPNFVTGLVLVFSLVFSSQVLAAETDGLAGILKKIDSLTCTQPEKLPGFYAKNLVIMVDDKRALLENRVKDYRQMMSDFRDMNCQTQRQVLSGKVGKDVSYVLVDEIISITSKSTDTDERQHSVCSYMFVREGSQWKISLEHCSSLPDYSIGPEDDALYYFHNPVY
ncbi:MAG: SnoaL-like domain-containing protein [Nitrospina sp.]|jgi:hypothetical protein|nr:SnoaL-like domain-containing protein [Nitrospina sp.]MBT3508005.1 SnoaL-like domain-containing protein [Nitrospina sp.]MBT3876532.1 SnoaL-like domain-containing protein [Nitrospina sp.]MBT4049551.1 SnoaL-like domain-containing protein [Nitrospina sp.]MBT4558263.1 SnoaL-like domain-containing protein [Nitrospina sp.]